MLRFSFSSALSTLPVLVVTSFGPSLSPLPSRFPLTFALPFAGTAPVAPEYVSAKGAAADEGGKVPFAAGNVAVLYAGEFLARVKNAGEVAEVGDVLLFGEASSRDPARECRERRVGE